MNNNKYVHGYDPSENTRLQDQAATLVDLLHNGTVYTAGSRVLEAGCGVGAQTLALAKNSPKAHITSIDISDASVAEAKIKSRVGGLHQCLFSTRRYFQSVFRSKFIRSCFCLLCP